MYSCRHSTLHLSGACFHKSFQVQIQVKKIASHGKVMMGKRWVTWQLKMASASIIVPLHLTYYRKLQQNEGISLTIKTLKTFFLVQEWLPGLLTEKKKMTWRHWACSGLPCRRVSVNNGTNSHRFWWLVLLKLSSYFDLCSCVCD